MGWIDTLRWQLFKALSEVGWRVCPEPHRTIIRDGLGTPEEFTIRVAKRRSDLLNEQKER